MLHIDRETINHVKAIVEHTPSYHRDERSSIICKNLRNQSHPYYTEYRPLRSLCLQILQMEEVKYGEVDDEICGILFDGAWLWEEYVNTILQKEGFIHPENRKRKGGIFLFEDRTGIRYPDFYKDEMVLDAKYKRLGSYRKISQAGRDELHQLITYVTNLNLPKGGFIAPLTERQQVVPRSKLKYPSATLFILGIEISRTATSYADFCQQMKENEKDFLASLHQQ